MKGEMLLKLSQSFGTGTGTIGSHFDLSCASLHALAAQNQRRQLIQFLGALYVLYGVVFGAGMVRGA